MLTVSKKQTDQGRRKHLKLGGGGTTNRGYFFLKKNGAFSIDRKGTSLFIAKSWGARSPSSHPRSLRL